MEGMKKVKLEFGGELLEKMGVDDLMMDIDKTGWRARPSISSPPKSTLRSGRSGHVSTWKRSPEDSA